MSEPTFEAIPKGDVLPDGQPTAGPQAEAAEAATEASEALEVDEAVITNDALVGALRTLRANAAELRRLALDLGADSITACIDAIETKIGKPILGRLLAAQGGQGELDNLDRELQHEKEPRGLELWPRRYPKISPGKLR